MTHTPDNDAFKTFLHEAEAGEDDRAEFTDAKGRRWMYERPPQPGVVRRVTLFEAGGEIGLLTTTFAAADARPETYPADAPFVAGHEVSVMAPAGMDDPMLSWEEVEAVDELSRQLDAALVADGWVVNTPPKTPAQEAMDTAQQAMGIRVVFARYERGERVRMLMAMSKQGKRGGVSLTAMPGGGGAGLVP